MNGKTLTYDDVLSEVLVLEKTILALKNKLLSLVPSKYGSDVWWEKMDEEGLEQIKQGKIASFKSVNALMKDLNS